jgi:hypothetical protein
MHLLTVERLLAGNRLDKHAAAMLRRFVTGSLSTADRLHRQGRLRHPRCPLCGLCDSVHHRLFSCQHAGTSLKELIGDDEVYDVFEAEGRYSIAATLGWIPETFTNRGLADNVIRIWKYEGNIGLVELDTERGADFAFHRERPVFWDGSCYHPTGPILATAGGSALQLQEDGKSLDSVVTISVADELPQTAAAGEFLGFFAADK